jgi:hypothetical protein
LISTQCVSPRKIEVEWTFRPVKEYELLDTTSSLQDIHILHRGGAQIYYWSFGPIMNNLLLDMATCPTDLGND